MQVVHSAAASSSRCSKRTSRERYAVGLNSTGLHVFYSMLQPECICAQFLHTRPCCRLPSKPAAVGDSSSGQPSGPDPPQAARGADQPADADVAARVAALAAAAVKAQAESAAAARVAAAPLQTPSTAPAAAPPTTPSPTDTTLATAQAAGSAEAAVSNVGTNGNRNNSSSIAQEAPDASLPPTTGNGGPPPDDLPPIEELVIAAAQEEMKDELRVLHDAALGRFSESESSGSGDGQVPLLQRLAHFASGAFLKNSWPEVSSSPSSASSATKERDAAAAGLKTAAAAADDDDSATAAPGALTVPEVVEAVVLEPSSAEHTTDQQQQQPGKATSSSQGSMDDTSGEIEAVDEDEYEDGVGPAAAPMAWVPVTSVVALAMAAVAVAQWWPVLPDVWWGLNNGYARDVLWQMATTFPDTPVTQALQLVSGLRQFAALGFGGCGCTMLLHSSGAVAVLQGGASLHDAFQTVPHST